MEHLAEGDRLSVRRKLRNVLSDVIIEREVALLGSEDHAGGGKLFRDAAHVEDGLRSERHAEFKAGGAIRFFVDELAVAHDAERTTWRIGLVVGRKNLIHF